MLEQVRAGRRDSVTPAAASGRCPIDHSRLPPVLEDDPPTGGPESERNALRDILKPEGESRRVSRFVLILTAEHAHYGERAMETLSQPVRRPLRAVIR